MEMIKKLLQLADFMLQASALLVDEDNHTSNPKRISTFLNVVALGNVGAGKSAVLNSLIGHQVLPTGENGATLAPICVDLQLDTSLNTKSIVLQVDSKSQQVTPNDLRHSLQDRLSNGSGSGRSHPDEIYFKLRTSTAPPLKLIDLPGLNQRIMDETSLGQYGENNDAILLVIIPASQAPAISSSHALKLAKQFDSEGTRTVGVISKIDQVAGEQKSLTAVQALLAGHGPHSTADIPWVALIKKPLLIGAENSLETVWRAEIKSLKSILHGAPPSKLGRVALVDVLGKQIRNRMKVRLPNVVTGYPKSVLTHATSEEQIRREKQHQKEIEVIQERENYKNNLLKGENEKLVLENKLLRNQRYELNKQQQHLRERMSDLEIDNKKLKQELDNAIKEAQVLKRKK